MHPLPEPRPGPEDLRRWLEQFRPYLLAVAGAELDSELQAKAGASDIVQQSLLEADLAIREFRGQTQGEFLAWLRQILRNNMANLVRAFRWTEKRDLNRERSLDDGARGPCGDELPDPGPTPSEQFARTERLARLRTALRQLPSPFQEVVEWRNLELLPFTRIADRLGVTERAAQKIWVRAIRELRRRLAERR